jgi:hypothetical protein
MIPRPPNIYIGPMTKGNRPTFSLEATLHMGFIAYTGPNLKIAAIVKNRWNGKIGSFPIGQVYHWAQEMMLAPWAAVENA